MVRRPETCTEISQKCGSDSPQARERAPHSRVVREGQPSEAPPHARWKGGGRYGTRTWCRPWAAAGGRRAGSPGANGRGALGVRP